MANKLNTGGRLQISIIALVFFGPLLLATWMYMSGRLTPATSTNHGALISPVVSLQASVDRLPALAPGNAPWRMVYVNEGPCDQACDDALYRMRQIRLMLGKDMDRMGRVFLHGPSPPDKVKLLEQHRGLITISDKGLGELLAKGRPDELPPGGIYLVDPLNNLMMYFAPGIEPGDMADDLKHLLKLSRIG